MYLAVSPPFVRPTPSFPPTAPAACWWNLTCVASTMSHSMSGSSMHASSNRSQTPLSRQRMNRRCVLLQPPYSGGKSRHGAPVLTIQRTALTNFLLSLAIPPQQPALPGRSGSIFAHISSDRSWRWSASFDVVVFMYVILLENKRKSSKIS